MLWMTGTDLVEEPFIMTSYPERASRLHKGMDRLAEDIPGVMQPFGAVIDGALTDGELDAKTKELIAIALAAGLRCDPCIAHHAGAVVRTGATRGEIAEALGVAILMAGGPAVAYSVSAMEAVAQYSAAEAD
jgi:AhpD family alkylhydroperoxidase